MSSTNILFVSIRPMISIPNHAGMTATWVFAEPVSDQFQSRLSALILHCIMEQRRYCFVLVTSMCEDQTGHGQQVCDIRDRGPFSRLTGMELRRKLQRIFKPRR
jgi:formylmethanofuran dehydrogenase subunit A